MGAERPEAGLAGRIGAITRRRAVSWTPVQGRGYSPAGRCRIRLDDGGTAFAKVAADGRSADALRVEHLVYSHVTAGFLPVLLGWDDGDGEQPPILLLEDLTDAEWPPPWTGRKVDLVLECLEGVRAAPPPPGLPSLEADLRMELSGWFRVAAEPRHFLSLGLCSKRWLDRALPVWWTPRRGRFWRVRSFFTWTSAATTCASGMARAVLVDWNWSCVGNADFDLAFWLPSLASEGGPRPDEVLPNQPELAAVASGYFASYAPPRRGRGTSAPGGNPGQGGPAFAAQDRAAVGGAGPFAPAAGPTGVDPASGWTSPLA